MLQSRAGGLVVGARRKFLGLLEEQIGLGEALLVGHLQREMHQRRDSVWIIVTKRVLLKGERGAIRGFRGGEVLGQVGARTECHQALVLADVAGAECVCGQGGGEQQIDSGLRECGGRGAGASRQYADRSFDYRQCGQDAVREIRVAADRRDKCDLRPAADAPRALQHDR